MLKRTCVQFYGKRESRLVHAATHAHRSGDHTNAEKLHAAAKLSIRKRYEAWRSNGFRKPCRSAGRGR